MSSNLIDALTGIISFESMHSDSTFIISISLVSIEQFESVPVSDEFN